MNRLVFNRYLRKLSATTVDKLAGTYTAVEGSVYSFCLNSYSVFRNLKRVGFAVLVVVFYLNINKYRDAVFCGIDAGNAEGSFQLIVNVVFSFTIDTDGN